MHSHPGEEIIHVLEGVWEYQVGGKGAMTLKAGDVLFIPAGVKHGAKNVGSTVGVEVLAVLREHLWLARRAATRPPRFAVRR
jgi:quercetin dioxygenase-like cupin family protein